MRCAEPDCTYDAGTVCAMHGCPGRSNPPRPVSSPGMARVEGEPSLRLDGSPVRVSDLLHSTGVAE
jgi:hypothetical protein